jgi:hypothetical protein
MHNGFFMGLPNWFGVGRYRTLPSGPPGWPNDEPGARGTRCPSGIDSDTRRKITYPMATMRAITKSRTTSPSMMLRLRNEPICNILPAP